MEPSPILSKMLDMAEVMPLAKRLAKSMSLRSLGSLVFPSSVRFPRPPSELIRKIEAMARAKPRICRIPGLSPKTMTAMDVGTSTPSLLKVELRIMPLVAKFHWEMARLTRKKTPLMNPHSRVKPRLPESGKRGWAPMYQRARPMHTK